MANTLSQPQPACPVNFLVHRAQSGDRNAFDQLARHYRPLLFAMAFLRTSHKEEAEDLVQEVLTKAWQKLSTLADAALFLPWLKTVTANACISWHRRARLRPESLHGELAHLLPAEQGLPLKTLLEQDRQRALQHALLTLPEANRLALLMRIWHHASYEDIAAFTGVLASTVDGRIYRAKRQLRRLLYDAGADFLKDAPSSWPPNPMPEEISPQRRKRMSPTPKTTIAANAWEQPRALALFTRRFSTMIDAGISLVRSLEALQDMPAPFGEVALELKQKVQEGATLSQSMAERPELFSPSYIGMIRAGEVGGILEETLQRLSKVLAREWTLANRHPSKEAPLFWLLPAGKPLPATWEAMSVYQQTVTLSLFFEAFGMMLVSGVPILQAMRIVADLLPEASQEEWTKAMECVKQGLRFGPAMARMHIFPAFVLEMIRIGEESGSLDGVLYRLAESFEDDLEYHALLQAV